MEAKNNMRGRWVRVMGLLLIMAGLGFGNPAIKVRVTVDSAPVKAAMTTIGGQIVATVPLDSVLEAESKNGQWYKVRVVRDGVQISGYIHEYLVVPISEAEAQQALTPSGSVRAQADIVAEITRRIEEDKRLVRQEIEADKVVDDLSPLIAKAFAIDDRQEQKRIAGELFFWIGQACAKKGDLYGALKNFRSMFDVDYTIAKALTNNVAEQSISRIIDQADRIYKGLLVDYSLQVTTKPKEADLKINGKSVGLTPYIYRSTIPKISLSIEKSGFRTLQEEIFLTESTTSKEYTLASMGRNLAVRSSPAGARVFLDGQDTRAFTDCELPFVPYGSHSIRLVLDNYVPSEGTVDILEGEGPVSLSATLLVNTYVFAEKNGGPEVMFFRSPRAVAYDKEGNYYVVDESDVRIKKFNSEGRFLAAWGGAGREARVLRVPGGMAVDAAGNIYVTDMKACCVLKFDQTGRFVTKWGSEGSNTNELSRPSGIAVDAAGDLYVADTNNGRIVKFGPDGTVKKTWGKQGTKPGEFVYPAAVAVSRKNELIVVDLARIQKMTIDGVPIGAWGKAGLGEGEMKSPQGVFVDAFDSVYVADTGNNRVLKFDPSGKLVCQWGVPGSRDGQMLSPVSVAVNGNGNVMVVEKDNHRYQVFIIPAK
jgi:DNA-binding beta-propeller fold protein YncE